MFTRDDLIAHLLFMKKHDPDYAGWAARVYQDLLPDWSLGKGLREAMQKQQEKQNG